MELSNYYNQKKVKSLGFSDRLIKELLPEPVLEKNPHHEDGHMMKLWPKSIVKAAMKDNRFLNYQRERQHRSISMKNAAGLKKYETLKQVNEALKDLVVQVYPYETLLANTKKFYVRNEKESIRFASLSPKKLNKFLLNYVRHKCTNYEKIYLNLYGKYGCIDAYIHLREEAMKAIARFYPFLEEAVCEDILKMRSKNHESMEIAHKKYLEKRMKRMHLREQFEARKKKRLEESACLEAKNIK